MRHQTDPAVRIGAPVACPYCKNDNPRLQEWHTGQKHDRVLCLVCARHWTEAEEA